MSLDCEMFLSKYPMDNQTCTMILGSYGYTTDEVDLVWHLYKDPVRVKPSLILPEFAITGNLAEACSASYYTGSFACIIAKIYLKRQFEFYLLQTYIPSFLVVVLSWVSFWIDIEAVPARITLGLLTVLTMTTQASSISERLPRVSYIKAIDVWMATCLIFVFSALIEFSAVNVLYRRRKNQLSKLEREMLRMQMAQNADMFNQHECSNTASAGGTTTPTGGPPPPTSAATLRRYSFTSTSSGPCACMCIPTSGLDIPPSMRPYASPRFAHHSQAHAAGCHDNGKTELSYKPPLTPDSDSSAVRKRVRLRAQVAGANTLDTNAMLKGGDKAMMVEGFSRFFFPFSFFIFNIVYWVLYILVL